MDLRKTLRTEEFWGKTDLERVGNLRESGVRGFARRI